MVLLDREKGFLIMLIVENLSKSYGKLEALSQVSFEVNGGEIVGLLGPNGAGKSTALKAIASLVRPNSGRITIGGLNHHNLLHLCVESPDL